MRAPRSTQRGRAAAKSAATRLANNTRSSSRRHALRVAHAQLLRLVVGKEAELVHQARQAGQEALHLEVEQLLQQRRVFAHRARQHLAARRQQQADGGGIALPALGGDERRVNQRKVELRDKEVKSAQAHRSASSHGRVPCGAAPPAHPPASRSCTTQSWRCPPNGGPTARHAHADSEHKRVPTDMRTRFCIGACTHVKHHAGFC
jgi:hypothetical protein